MAYQTAANVLAAIKVESATGEAPGATGAEQLRIIDSPGLRLVRAPIVSAEKRNDNVRPMGRIGGKSVQGSYNCEATVGGAFDTLLQAIMRGTWSAASALVTADGGAALTSLHASSTSVITLTGTGSFITQGVRVGDVVRLANMTDSANDDLNLRVKAVAANTLTVVGTPLTVDTASTSAVLTRQKKLVTPTTPTRRSFAIDQYDQDVDLSELFLGCRCIGMRVQMQPNGHVTVQWTFMGLDRTALATGTSPYYTSPTVTTGLGLIADDASIMYNGSVITKLTGFTLDFQITAGGQPVIGSLVSPDVFDNDLAVSGQISGVREDFSNLTLFDAETEFEFSVLLQESESDPKDFLSFFLPRVKIGGIDAPFGGGDGAKIETLELMVGPKAAATGYDATVANICSSGA